MLAYLIFTGVLLGIRCLDDHFVIDWHGFKASPYIQRPRLRPACSWGSTSCIICLCFKYRSLHSSYIFPFNLIKAAHFISTHTAADAHSSRSPLRIQWLFRYAYNCMLGASPKQCERSVGRITGREIRRERRRVSRAKGEGVLVSM